MTITKQENNINKLENSHPIYELELELTSKKGNPNIKHLNILYKEVTTIIKILQQSNYIVSKTIKNNILEIYADLLNVDKIKMTNLAGRRAQSLEIQHVIEQLPNKYAVTDKADGERHFIFVHNNDVFLISYNLEVKRTGIRLPISKKQYNNSILDGEYIFLPDYNRHIFMIFDCLYYKGDDIRNKSSLMERLKFADEIVNICFVLEGQKGFDIKEYNGKFNAENILSFHSEQIDKYMSILNNDIKYSNNLPLIRRKYFIQAFGGQDNEIYKYSYLLWNKFIFNKKTNCPYILDGLIYQPLDQKYIVSIKESKFFEYKWKPLDKNSIDFYVQFERSSETGKILTLYDNSRDESMRGKPYKIALLHVGHSTRYGEQPVLFQQDSGKYNAHLFLEDGEVRDLEGYVIQDNTVVEFAYNNDLQIPEKHRWVPLRTRYDKTESVQRHNKGYGNYYTVANKVWRSISNPFTINDIGILAKDNLHNKHISLLRGKIDHSVIMSERKENIYYQIRTNLAKPMRNFHNWIKSIVIYTYCFPKYDQGRNVSVLDIACGPGGDIMRFYHSKVDFYVGVDIDNNNLISPTDGAISRYNQMKKSFPKFPRMSFIHADAGALLDYDEQVKVIGNMSERNITLMNKFFSLDAKKRTMFDRINCQFAIHFFLINDTTWYNFIQNINMYMKPNGYMLITSFDAGKITELLKDKDQFTSYYTNTNGEKKILFEIVKKYKESNDGIYRIGNAIDVHNGINQQENTYVTEYLVDKKFLEEEFLKKCDMELVETDLFYNQFHIHKEYFTETVKFEENVKTKQFLLNAAEYYDFNNEVNRACYEFSQLNRYYVFRKKDKSQKGGQKLNKYEDFIFDNASDFLNPNKFIKRKFKGYADYTFLSSIYDILINSDIIPKSVNMHEFYNDIGYELQSDLNIDTANIVKLSKNLIIGHEMTYTDDSPDLALNGLNILVFNNESNGNSTNISAYSKKDTLSRKIPTILLYKNDNKFCPIYKIRGPQLVGMFDTKTRLINRLVEGSNGEFIN
jgi:hypothetical protein